MLLVIDVGNTNMVLGVYKDTELLDHWRVYRRIVKERRTNTAC